MDRFTAEDAMDATGTEDAIIIEFPAADRICRQHSTSIEAYHADHWLTMKPMHCEQSYDAGHIMAWLGY